MKTVTVPVSKTGALAEFIKRAFLYRNNYLILVCAFLLGSSNITSGLLPLGAVFFAASYSVAPIKILTAVAVVSGVAFQRSLEQVYISAASMLLFGILRIPQKETNAKLNLKLAATLLVSLLVPQLMLAALRGFLLYDILKAFLSSFISFVLFVIFRLSVPVIAGVDGITQTEGEETVSVAVTAALVLSGAGALQLFGVSLRNILFLLLLLFISYKCGAGAGATAGLITGLITGMSQRFTPSAAGAYALCGMLAGLLGNLGKFGAAGGFILANVILAVYFNAAAESALYLRETIAAGIVFFTVPDKYISRLVGPFRKNAAVMGHQMGYSRRIRDITVERLLKFSKAFSELSKTFSEIAKIRQPAENHDINVLFDRVADRICRDCSLCMHCWERNFYDTYQIMFKIVESLEAKGRVDESNVPSYFIEKCPRISEFVNAVNNMYELYRAGIVWKSRLSESRAVIGRQFEGMANVITGLAGEINSEVNFLSPLEDSIITSLRAENIKVDEVTAYKNAWGKYEIGLMHAACGGARVCVGIAEKKISDAVGRKMIRENETCRRSRDGNCSLKFVEAENLKLTTGIAKLPKFGSRVSGDSFTFMNSGNGKYTLALSDGMGTGHSALTQSKATIGMLESFLESGFDKGMAVSLINSVLVLKSDEDNTSTIDVAVVDLHNGEAEFVKIGAAPTFIKKKSGVEVIKSVSLPAGILPGIDTELAKRSVEGGDMIIMVTDGIIDSMTADEPGDKQLVKLIQQLESLNPQQVADSLLESAGGRCNGKPCDDLTVLVAKVWRKPG